MNQRKQTKRRFSPEFKLKAIEQVVKYQQRVVDITRVLKLDSSTLGKQVRQYEAEMRGVHTCQRSADIRAAAHSGTGKAVSSPGKHRYRAIKEEAVASPNMLMEDYRLVSMKIYGKRLHRYPDFVEPLHFIIDFGERLSDHL